MYSGPHIKRDGLVFGYDTGYGIADNNTSTRFYKGAPTINYIHHQNAVAQDSYSTYTYTTSGTWQAKHSKAIRAYNASGNEITGYVNGGVSDPTNKYHAHWQYDTVLKKPVVVMEDVDASWKAKSYGTGIPSWESLGKAVGDTYTISWLQWTDNLSKSARVGLYTRTPSNSYNFWDGLLAGSTAKNTKLRTWQRVHQTYTTSSSRNLSDTYANIYMYGHYDARATIKIADVQFTWGSTPSPYSAEYERTSTASLVDLTKTTDIDVANVSFDSTGQPTFDGTDDILNTGLFSGRNPSTSPFTVEAILKSDITSGNRMWLDATGNGSNQRFYSALDDGGNNPLGIQGSSWQDPIPNTTNFIHQTIVMDGSTARSYRNGVATYTKSYTPYTLAGPLNIGGRSGYRWIGTIPVVKVYNRALSAQEVEQNFRAYKNRFDI